MLVSKTDPTKSYFVTATFSNGTVTTTSAQKLVTTAPQTTSLGSKVYMNGSQITVTKPPQGGIYVKYRSFSGGTNEGILGGIYQPANWIPLFPQKVTVTVKYQDESGKTISPDTTASFYSQIQSYTVSNIPQTISGLVYNTNVGNLTGRDTATVILKYKVDANSLSDSTSD